MTKVIKLGDDKNARWDFYRDPRVKPEDDIEVVKPEDDKKRKLDNDRELNILAYLLIGATPLGPAPPCCCLSFSTFAQSATC